MVDQDQVVVALAQGGVLLLQVGICVPLFDLVVQVLLQLVHVLDSLLVPYLRDLPQVLDRVRGVLVGFRGDRIHLLLGAVPTLPARRGGLPRVLGCLRVRKESVPSRDPRASLVVVLQGKLGGVRPEHTNRVLPIL